MEFVNAKAAYEATERRLSALPFLKVKLSNDREKLQELKEHGPRAHSRDLVRFRRSGTRISPEEVLEALITDAEASIAADEYEVSKMEKTLSYIAGDPYYSALSGKYFDGLNDEQIAAGIPCDKTTVWRNRKRLVERVSILLYGAAALK